MNAVLTRFDDWPHAGITPTVRAMRAAPLDIDVSACSLCGRETCEDHIEPEDDGAPAAHLLINDVDLLMRPAQLMIIEQRVPAASLVAIVGMPGAAKTFAALDMALCVATGEPWLGARIERSGIAIYVVAEGLAGIAKRVRSWKIRRRYALDVSTGLWAWPGAVNLMNSVEVANFIDAVTPKAPVIIVLDTLNRCMVGGDENSPKDMTLAVAAADRIRAGTAATVVLVHHTTKAGQSERGHSSLRGALDTMLMLRQTDDLRVLSCAKSKDFEPFADMNVELSPEGSSCVMQLAADAPADDVVPTLTADQRRCLRALCESFGPQGATRAEWKVAVPDVREHSFYRAVTRLAAAMLVAIPDKAGARITPTPLGRRSCK